MTLKKNQTITAKIEGYSAEGAGITKVDGYPVFVPFAARGDVCEILLVKVKPTFAFGKLLSVVSPSPHRVPPGCPAFRSCGGCAFRHITYEEELAAKEERVAACVKRIGGIDRPPLPICPSPSTERYRNKAMLPVGGEGGKTVWGLYRPRSHALVPLRDCALLPKAFAPLADLVTAFADEAGIPPYDERTGTGVLRHIYLRSGDASGEIGVTLVAAAKALPNEAVLAERLMRANPRVKSVVLNTNWDRGNAILGKGLRRLAGKDGLRDTLCGFSFDLSPLAFYQVNHRQAERLYQTGIEWLALSGTETVLELYSGAGTISLALSPHVGEVIGVEIVEEAVQNARKNAALNGVSNASFFCADAGQAARDFAAKGRRPDVLVVDPPRKGLDRPTLDAVLSLAAPQLLYISCDPATFARDAGRLCEGGYTLRQYQPFDLFARTSHVECVALMSRVEN